MYWQACEYNNDKLVKQKMKYDEQHIKEALAAHPKMVEQILKN